MESERKKVRALIVFEVAIIGYLITACAVQTWLVYFR